MSGGSFDYAYFKVEMFADELADKLNSSDKVNKYGEKPYLFEEVTMMKLHEIEKLARYTFRLMKEVEYLYSGDTSDDSFMARVTEIEQNKF